MIDKFMDSVVNGAGLAVGVILVILLVNFVDWLSK